MAWLTIRFCISSGRTRAKTVTAITASSASWSLRLPSKTHDSSERRVIGRSGSAMAGSLVRKVSWLRSGIITRRPERFNPAARRRG
jgi:hypothetical protein